MTHPYNPAGDPNLEAAARRSAEAQYRAAKWGYRAIIWPIIGVGVVFLLALMFFLIVLM